MMKVIYCDRCGKIIDKENRNPYQQSIIPINRYIILKSNPLTYEIDIHVDLCPDCQEKLDEWIKECKAKED